MQKRSEAVKAEKIFFRTKLKHTAVVVLCVLFALSTIYVVDISTTKLLKDDRDQYAVRVSRQDEDTIRLDLVGGRYAIDIQNIRSYAVRFRQKTIDLISGLQSKLR